MFLNAHYHGRSPFIDNVQGVTIKSPFEDFVLSDIHLRELADWDRRYHEATGEDIEITEKDLDAAYKYYTVLKEARKYRAFREYYREGVEAVLHGFETWYVTCVRLATKNDFTKLWQLEWDLEFIKKHRSRIKM